MAITVASRVHRNLRPLRRFRRVTEGRTGLPYSREDIPLSSNEELLGVYENAPGALENAIAVTDRGLHVHRGHDWESICYSSVVDADFYPSKTGTVEKVMVHLRNGESVVLPVTGGDPSIGSKDAASFLTFLIRVVEDREAAAGG